MSIIKEINRRKAEARKEFDGRMQLCWLCRKAIATPGCHCSWSKDLIPVPGWTATESEAKGYTNYYITRCPEFMPDEIVFAHAIDTVRSDHKMVLFRFMNEVKQHYGVLDEDAARFVINHCALHDDKLREMGYSVERGLTVEPPVGGGGSEPIRRNETSKMCCGTCQYYERQSADVGYGYACIRSGNEWKRYGDFCPHWSRKRPKKSRGRVHHSYMDPNASLKGGCKMRDCIYSGALSGAELDTASRSTLYCNYSQIEGHCRTVDGEHKIENGRCDLYQRDTEKRKRFMAKKKKKEMTRIKLAVEKTGGTE